MIYCRFIMSNKIDINSLLEGAIELREGVKQRKEKSKKLQDLANRAKQASTDDEREKISKESRALTSNHTVISLDDAIYKIVRAIGNYEHINSQSNHRKDIT